MEATKKKIKLEERRTMIEEKKAMLEEKQAILKEKKVKIAVDAEDAKMLSLKVESLDADARMIVQVVLYKMLGREKDDLEVADKEEMEAAEEEEAKAAYTAATTP